MNPEIKKHYESLVFEEVIVKDEGGVAHQQFVVKEDQALGVLLLEGIIIETRDWSNDDGSTFHLWLTDELSWLDEHPQVPMTEMDLLFQAWWDNQKWGPLTWLMEEQEFRPPEHIEVQMRAEGVWEEYFEEFRFYEEGEQEEQEFPTLKEPSEFSNMIQNLWSDFKMWWARTFQ